MGMFDYLLARCPNCEARIDAQIKADCCFDEYNLDRPICISDAQKLVGNVVKCPECEKNFEISGDLPTHKVHLHLKELK